MSAIDRLLADFWGGEITDTPPDLHPRLLNYVCQSYAADSANFAALMFQAQHFTLGLAASQRMCMMTAEHMRDIREELSVFAPHPFEKYTVSFWMGTPSGMTEALLVVAPDKLGRPSLGMWTMLWGEDAAAQNSVGLLSKEELRNPSGPGTLTENQKLLIQQKLFSWDLLDVFRLLMARPSARINNQVQGRRPSMSRGKKVWLYTAKEITIDLDADLDHLIERGVAGSRKPPKGYPYRAHLCHSGGQEKGCTHDWIEIGGRAVGDVWIPDEKHPKFNATWECYYCGRKRWARRDGYRGDASTGLTQHAYTVKGGRDDVVIRS